MRLKHLMAGTVLVLAALDIPFKAVAREDASGKVWLSDTNASYLRQRHTIDAADRAVDDIDATIEKIAAAALD